MWPHVLVWPVMTTAVEWITSIQNSQSEACHQSLYVIPSGYVCCIKVNKISKVDINRVELVISEHVHFTG